MTRRLTRKNGSPWGKNETQTKEGLLFYLIYLSAGVVISVVVYTGGTVVQVDFTLAF